MKAQHSACPDQTWVFMFKTCLSPQSRFSVNGVQDVDEPPINLNQLRSKAGSFIKGSSAWMFKGLSCTYISEGGLEIKVQSTFPCSLCMFCGRSSASDLWQSRWLVIISQSETFLYLWLLRWTCQLHEGAPKTAGSPVSDVLGSPRWQVRSWKPSFESCEL